ncbi:hypothetical protein EDF75_4991 [Raoultella sp. BIGb0149]|nr:hypothetical protein EDF75_4991 [Raoultella sp. BIGb0149]
MEALNFSPPSRHTSDYRGVGRVNSPRSLTGVSSRGFAILPPFCRPNYLGRASSRYTSDYRGVGCVNSPRSLTGVSSRGFAILPPFCRPNYLGRASCHTSGYRCVGCVNSPRSLTGVSSRGFAILPPSCSPNYLGRFPAILQAAGAFNYYGSSRLEPSVARLSSTSCARRASASGYF